jgi:hypothetical protein
MPPPTTRARHTGTQTIRPRKSPNPGFDCDFKERINNLIYLADLVSSISAFCVKSGCLILHIPFVHPVVSLIPDDRT